MPLRLTLALVALAASATGLAGSEASRRAQDQSAITARIDELFSRQISADTPGCAVGVYRDGVVVLTRAYGVASVEDGRPITPGTNFNLGSLSKPFTTLAVLLLEQRGKLSLNDDVRRYVTELPFYGRPILVQDLLQHTSGFRDFQTLEVLSGRPVTSMTDFLGLVAAQRALNFEPGAQHEYSHTDYGILGLIVERVAGEAFGPFLERELFAPLGMSRTIVADGRSKPVSERAYGHGGTANAARIRFPASETFGGDNVYSSVEDLAHWDRNFATPSVGGTATIEKMLSRPVLPKGQTIPYAYGLRLGTYRGLRTVARGGHAPGARAEWIRFPDQHLTVATLCNADDLDARRFAESVADLYLDPQMKPRPSPPTAPAAVTVSSGQLTRYAGTYGRAGDPWDRQRIEVRNGVLGEVLFHDERDEEFYPMTPAGAGRFFEIGRTGNVGILAFTPPVGIPSRLAISWNDVASDVLERIPDSSLWRPTPAVLAGYSGHWFTPDLDVTWRLESRDTRLVLRRRGRPDVTLRPITRDRFLRALGPDAEWSVRFQFRRDAGGRIADLTIFTPAGEDSVRNLRFVRVEAK